MRLFKLMTVFAAIFLSCSTASAQAPAPVPDPGPQVGEVSLCQACCGIETAIADKQALYAQLEAEIEILEQDILIAQNLNWPHDLKQAVIAEANMMIWDLEEQMADIANDIHDLWDLYFALECDEADC